MLRKAAKMKSRFLFSWSVGILIFNSCASSALTNVPVIAQFDKLKIGQSESEAILLVGKPSGLYPVHGKNVWVYTDSNDNKIQRASISFGQTASTIMEITILPRADELESNLDYLKNKKFPLLSNSKLVKKLFLSFIATGSVALFIRVKSLLNKSVVM